MFCAMNLTKPIIRCLLFVYLLANGLKVYAQDQDSTWNFPIDRSLFKRELKLRIGPNYLYHSPNKNDEQRFKKYKYLIGQKPKSKNHDLYYSLACSLWDLEKTTEAERMFLTIINSTKEYYASTYYHSSDIPGDTTKNIYGYGSYTSNYKNNAAIYLTKIYLEQKKYDKALQYLEDAVNKYKVTYNCGTHYHWQQEEYEFLYASCYEGLNRHKEVIDLLMPSCLDRNDEIIIEAIKKTYSQKEIQESLQKGEASIDCSLDTFPSYSYLINNYGTKKEKTDTIKYYSGTGIITLFDRRIKMPLPDLGNGEHLTKEHFIKRFKESNFYIKLKEDI